VLSVLKDTFTEEAARVEGEPAVAQPEVDHLKVPDTEGEL